MSDASAVAPELIVQLFIAGDCENTRAVCRRVSDFAGSALKRPYRIDIIDVFEQPELADRVNVLVTPTLVIHALKSGAEQRLVGDLSDAAKLQLLLPEFDSE
jgi:circadian clock protein KaiB